MANAVQDHPETEQLRAFSQGALADEAASQWISRHLESCPACLRTLESLSSDTLESLVRAAHKPDATADFGGAAPADAEADDLRFLAPPQAPDEIGRLGPYRVLKVIGSGGMGIVFQAEDIALKRRVALKVMKPQAARRPKAKERFLREAQAAAAIEHDHIVTIHQVGEERGVPFLAMQWLKGMNLEDRLRAKGDNAPPPLNTQHILRIGQQIAVGLAAAHEQGLIHRDIKPANLWLTPEHGGRIKILDFGLARALADDVRLTQSGTIVGTPAFMAPEQGRGDNVDHRCDLFSLGVVLYRLTTGRLPFRGENTMAVLTSLAMDTPEPPRQIVGELPAELSDLIMQMLAKDPAQRPATARAVFDRLQRIDQQLGTPRPQPEQTEELPIAQPSAKKPSRKWPVAIAVALVGLALLAAATVFFLQTPSGTVRIEINDDSIEATLTKNAAVIKGADKAHDITVAAGEHALKIKRGDLEFETDKFVLKKGDTVTLKIELLPGKVQVVQDDKVIGEKALPIQVNDHKTAAWVLSLGGTVVIVVDGQEFTIRAAKDLPAGLLTLSKIESNGKKQIDDASLKELAGLQSLQTLDLRGTSVTDAGLKELAGLKSLVSLVLDSTQVTDAGLKELTGLKSLQSLNLGNTKVTDAGLKDLAKLKNLQLLCLWGTPVTDAGLAHLQGKANLKALDLTWAMVTAEGVAALQKALPGCQITSDGAPAVAGDADRKAAAWVLSQGGTVVIHDGHWQTIRAVKDLPAGPWTLHKIDLKYKKQVDDAGLKKLAGLTSLQTLELTGTKVTGAGLKELANLNSLQALSLWDAPVTDAGLKELVNLKSLNWLSLGKTKVTDVGLKELAGLKGLRELILRGTEVTDAGLLHLQNLTNLQTLDLTKTTVTAEGIAALQKALPGCRIISDLSPAAGDADRKAAVWVLSLGGYMIIDDGQQRVVRAAKDLPAGPWTLLHIDLLNNKQVDGAGLKELAGLKGLQSLHLGGTPVTDAGLKELAGLKSLRILNLDSTKATDAGLKELAGLQSLQVLSLRETKVAGAGLKELAGLKSLRLLSLSGTPVTYAGLRELAGLPGLQDLNLGGTKVTDAGLKELAGIKSLQILHLWDTPVTDAGLVHLRELANLKEVGLTKTAVTAQGVAMLQKALPGCKISSDLSPAAGDADRKAAEWVLSLGGSVTINDGQERTVSAAKDLPAGQWRLLNIDLHNNKQVDDAGLKALAGLKSLRVLNLDSTKVADAGLGEMVGLKELHWLSLGQTSVTDAGLKKLAALQSLQLLNLGGTSVTDAGLKELAGLQNLFWLQLVDTKVTDAGLKQLGRLARLQTLNLEGTLVTDAGLKELAALKDLRALNLANTSVTGVGLKELTDLQGLNSLVLSNAPVTDAGLRGLAGFKRLPQLNLSGTKVTDAGLVHLQDLTNLKTLDLTKTKVTANEIAVLQKALPDCKIISDMKPTAGGNNR